MSPLEEMVLAPAEHWVWSNEHKSCDAELSSDRLATYFHTSPLLESSSVAGLSWILFIYVLFMIELVKMCALFRDIFDLRMPLSIERANYLVISGKTLQDLVLFWKYLEVSRLFYVKNPTQYGSCAFLYIKV